MRRRTVCWLQAVFSVALAACREKSAAVPPANSGSDEARASGAASVSANSVVIASGTPTAEPTTTVTIGPNELRPGQTCTGSFVAALHPHDPVDYLEIRLDYYPQRTHEIVTAGRIGTPCATAKDAPACLRALAAASDPAGEYLVYTRGDEVRTVTGHETPHFLAPIESPEEAAFAYVWDFMAENHHSDVHPPCDAATFIKTETGFKANYVETSFCNEKRESTLTIDRDGRVHSETKYTPPIPNCHPPMVGRRPEGFTHAPRRDVSIGSHFAECAEMEAASVFAFRRLERELSALGAPAALLRRAQRSARDEVRHAQSMHRLARRFGARPNRVRLSPHAPRAMREMALENVVEGCVFETWAALLASFQAEHASEPEIRALFRGIARDETEHAALAWDVAAWLDARLSAEDRAVVARAQSAALAKLAAELEHELPPPVRELTGMPAAAEARALFESWSRALASSHAA